MLIDPQILPDSFAIAASHICTLPYIREGTDKVLADFGPAQYHSAAEYEHSIGKALPSVIIGGGKTGAFGAANIKQATLETDPQAEENLLARAAGYWLSMRRNSIACTSTASSIPRAKCRPSTRPCRRMAV